MQQSIYDVTTRKIPHPTSTNFDEDNDAVSTAAAVTAATALLEQSPVSSNGSPNVKRRRLSDDHDGTPSPASSVKSARTRFQRSSDQNVLVSPSSTASKRSRTSKVADAVPGSDDESLQNITTAEVAEVRITTSELEAALPPVKTDAEAIEAYEAYRAAEDGDNNIKPKGNATLEERMQNSTWTRGRSSIYVDAFNLALNTVLEDEEHLFDEAEKQVFESWRQLTYEAQYLYVRLFLRKTSAWFRIAKLAYYGDIADMNAAVEELQKIRKLPKIETPVEQFPGENVLPDEALPLGSDFVFAESSDDNITTLNEASSLLLLDELKTIAKDAKVNGKNKTELLYNLRRTSGKQRGLGFLKRSETEDSMTSELSNSNYGPLGDVHNGDGEGDFTPDGASTPRTNLNRDDHFTRKILEQTGKCVRLSLIPLKLFERVHLVFYRSTEWTEKSLTTLILAKISRRNFPEYIVSRSATIFESRSMLLEFEASLRTQFRVDSILELNGTPSRRGLEDVKATFEAVYPRWQALLVKEQLKEERLYETGEGAYLRRFSPAWVYTRIVHKALAILARFKEHLREHGLLCELLDQRLFHAARRGVWYSRKALLEEHYMYALKPCEGRAEEANKKHWKRIALKTCEQGLQDNECHVIYHYDLQKRIKKLEKQLRIPKREQHDFGHVGLLKARERDVEGIKLEYEERPRPILRRKSSTSSNLARSRSRERAAQDSDGTPTLTQTPTQTPTQAPTQTPTQTSTTPPPPPKRQSTKTIWLDELDTEEPVSVESMSLSYYRKVLHYKGYHSEGGILRVLFGLLFYDIMFSLYVPNVFQTAYQTCPLDLHTDAFYSARRSEINQLINRITNGEAETIIKQTWTDHFERKTCIVGVRWEEYELDDLVEIARCWNGEALGVVMRVMAQEYGDRGGGVPDLFLWRVNNIDRDGQGCEKEVEERDDQKLTTPTKQQVSNGVGDGSKDGDGNKIVSRNPFSPSPLQRKQQQQQQISISSTSPMSTTVSTTVSSTATTITPYGKIMFSEVKSENDRLSDTQRLWISVLLNAGVEVELCHAVAREVIKR